MPSRCCVPGCSSRSDGHSFPKSSRLLMKWRVAIRRADPKSKKLWNPSRHSVVCRSHFSAADYKPSDTGKKPRLKEDAVPSVFSFSKIQPPQRRSRQVEEYDVPDMQSEVTISSPVVESIDVCTEPHDDYVTIGTQCDLLSDASCRLSIHNFKDNHKAVLYYTGFDDYNHFMYFFNVLGPAVNHLSYKCSLLPAEDQLFLSLLKLRQARDDFDLSILFHISESTVSTLFVVWTNFLYFQLDELDLWATQDVVKSTMPENFKERFPSTRVILDATETPICKPSNVQDQRATFSRYKNKNTLKTMIGCSPRGLITFISDSYGGSCSDRQIIERCKLVNPNMFSSGDSIMADRGIMVQDIFSSANVKVNTPTMLKGRSQLEPEEVVHDRRVASKRIHVERVIGLGKTYKILKRELHHSKVPLGSRIVSVCYMLSNFRPNIVNRLA